ncbi:MAG: hypothetical protein K0U93_30875, partial [Gammaproteobacteria bacterium]|nr:hypothetical protein [Gammaproteobacteria bacterium]
DVRSTGNKENRIDLATNERCDKRFSTIHIFYISQCFAIATLARRIAPSSIELSRTSHARTTQARTTQAHRLFPMESGTSPQPARDPSDGQRASSDLLGPLHRFRTHALSIRDGHSAHNAS